MKPETFGQNGEGDFNGSRFYSKRYDDDTKLGMRKILMNEDVLQ